MMYAIIKGGEVVEVYPGRQFVDGAGIQRSPNWLDLAKPAERTAAGVFDIVEPPAAPEGKVVRVLGLEVVNGVPKRRFVVEDAPAPPKPPIPESISDRQFAQVLALDGVITQDEALAWAARGDLPKRLTDALLEIPEAGGHRFGARMMLSAATTYERHHPLVPTLGALLGMDAAALDSIWTRGAAL